MVTGDRASVAHFTIITTNKCTARCAHCMMHSGPHRDEALSSALIIEALDGLLEVRDVGVLVFAGGEPTTLGDDLFNAIAEAELRGVPTRVVSNAEWATSDSAAFEMIASFRDAGLRELNLSTDDFHSKWIPLDNIERAWKASKNMGFDSVVLAVCAGPRSRVTPGSLCKRLDEEIPLRYQPSGNELPLPEPSEDGSRYMISNSRVYRLGRGKGLRSDYLTGTEDTCNLRFGCPHIGDNPTLNASGGWGVCCGLSSELNPRLQIGHVGKNSIATLLAIQDEDWLLHAIRTLGPMILLEFLQAIDPTVQTRRNYTSICEACQDLICLPDSTLNKLRESGFVNAASSLLADQLQRD